MNQKQVLNISHYVLKTGVLGPYLRSAVWVNGCCFDCDGCIAKEMNGQAPDKRNIRELTDIFLKVEGTEGITISGGEPFLQADALAGMIDGIRAKRDYGVIVYSGFTLEELQGISDLKIHNLLKKIDILIDGKYRNDLDDGLPFRGSSNQRIILLTDRYKDVFNRYYMEQKKRNIEIKRDHIYMVGVPSKSGLKTWRELKKKAQSNVE